MPYLTDPERLEELLADQPPFRARQLRHWLYRSPRLTAAEMVNLPVSVRAALEERLWPFRLEHEQTGDGGATIKWLLRTGDGSAIEAVAMGYPRRTTLCISSQAGCAMRCTFCATGQFGFERHLETGEIVAQVAFANAVLHAAPLATGPARVTNVVFMGMGEPLANFERVSAAITRFMAEMGISARAITVSTVGVVPGMRRLAEEGRPVGLAVSLHAADDETRARLVPLNRTHPLAEVVAAASEYHHRTGRRVSLEWALIDGVNDGANQARALAAIARQLRAHVNVIPLNPTPLSDYAPPSPTTVAGFMRALRAAGANATLRHNRGTGIDAACGQLRLRAPQPLPSSSGA